MKQGLLQTCIFLVLLNGIVFTAEAKSFRGFYLGLQTGGITAQFQTPFTLLDAATLAPLSRSQSTNGDNGYAGGVQLGYGLRSQYFYLGAEARAIFNTARASSVVKNIVFPLISSNSFISAKSSYGMVLRPGMMITPKLMWYVLGGVAWARIKGFSSLITVLNTVQYRMGGVAGSGFEVDLRHHCSLRLEYAYASYQDVQLSGIVIIPPPLPSRGIASISTRTSTNQFMLGFNGYFNE